MTPVLCACGCGEPVTPGRRYRFTHYARTVRGPGHAAETASPRVPCSCGCGGMAQPGKRYIRTHQSRLAAREAL